MGGGRRGGGVVFCAAFGSRLLTVVFGSVFAAIFPTYDTSAGLDVPPCGVDTVVNRVVDAVTLPFAYWDSVHFLSLAERGWVLEKSAAFFGGLPLCIYGIAEKILLPLFGDLMCPRTLYRLAGMMITNSTFVLAVVAFYVLSCRVLKDERLARTAAFLMCCSPANVFFSAIYTESPYALASMTGLVLLNLGWMWSSSLSFATATWFRSNGVLYAFVILIMQGISISSLAQCALVGFPLVAHLMWCYLHYCPGLEWCSHLIPNAYSYVQSYYWSNGLFRYWTINNIPNFALAAPMVLTAFVGSRTLWAKGNGMCSGPQNLRLMKTMTAMWLAMTSLAVFTMNVQVVTRFVSALPPLYWYAAVASKDPLLQRVFLSFFLVYSIVGVALFCTFLPWT